MHIIASNSKIGKREDAGCQQDRNSIGAYTDSKKMLAHSIMFDPDIRDKYGEKSGPAQARERICEFNLRQKRLDTKRVNDRIHIHSMELMTKKEHYITNRTTLLK